jgi:hypothetical protein
VFRTPAFLALRALTLTALATPVAAHAGGPTPTGERVSFEFKDMTIDFGNLHLSANLLGYELASPDGGPISGLMGAFEFGESFMVRGSAVFPMLGFLGAGDSPVRIEAGVSFHSTSVAMEMESVTLEQTESGDYRHTKSIKVPALNRNSLGVGAGLMFRNNGVETKVDGKDFQMRGTHLTAYVGVSSINAAGYALEAKGYGDFTNYRWTNGGLDLLVDVTQSYDKDPDDAPGRFGGRLWGETIFGRDMGLSARLEIGYMPGDMGFYLLAGLGIGLNFGI